MATTKKKTEPTFCILTEEEGRGLLRISGDEFARRYDSGYYDDKPELHEQVIELYFMLPLFRSVP